jgi:hypothetical protein
VNSTISNARAIEAALQRLQGPPAAGKLLVKPEPLPDGSPGPDVVLPVGACAMPQDGNAIDERAAVYVRPNPANPAEDSGDRTWTVTAAGTLVDVESVQGGAHTNRDGGTSYRWDPPLEGVELVSVTDASGIAGGSFSGAFAALRQFAHLKTINFVAGQGFFESQTVDFPAAVLAWGGIAPLDGPLAAAPGPRTARTKQGAMLYRQTWMLYLGTSRLDSSGLRSNEGATLLDDVLGVIAWACRIRDRSFIVSGEPGAQIQSARPYVVSPTAYVDAVTIETSFVLERNPEPRAYHDWLRTRLRQQVPPGGQLPLIDLPNAIVPMPPNGPGTPPFP